MADDNSDDTGWPFASFIQRCSTSRYFCCLAVMEDGRTTNYFWIGGINSYPILLFFSSPLWQCCDCNYLAVLGPIVITVYYVIFHHQLPSRSETIGMVLALLGAFFVVTHGHITHLAVSPALLFWGLMSAVAVATSTLLPRPLLPTFGSVNVNGWGLLIGGVAMNFIQPMWVGVPTLTPKTVLSIGAVVLFGTLIAFVMYSVSLLYITPTTASLMDAFEPLAATVISILVLHTVFTWADALGGGLIILAVVMLSISYHAPKRDED